MAWERYERDHDLRALIAAVATRYATDPNYANLAATIGGQSNMAQAIAVKRQEESADAK